VSGIAAFPGLPNNGVVKLGLKIEIWADIRHPPSRNGLGKLGTGQRHEKGTGRFACNIQRLVIDGLVVPDSKLHE
jgi:hypothetical protein